MVAWFSRAVVFPEVPTHTGSVEGVTKTLQLSDAFVGVILLPIVAWMVGHPTARKYCMNSRLCERLIVPTHPGMFLVALQLQVGSEHENTCFWHSGCGKRKFASTQVGNAAEHLTAVTVATKDTWIHWRKDLGACELDMLGVAVAAAIARMVLQPNPRTRWTSLWVWPWGVARRSPFGRMGTVNGQVYMADWKRRHRTIASAVHER